MTKHLKSKCIPDRVPFQVNMFLQPIFLFVLHGVLPLYLLSVSLHPSPHSLFPCAGGNPCSCLTAVDEARHYVTGANKPGNQHSSLLAGSEAMRQAERGKQAGKGHIQYLWSLCRINSYPAMLQYSRQHLVNGSAESIFVSNPAPHSLPNMMVDHTAQYVVLAVIQEIREPEATLMRTEIIASLTRKYEQKWVDRCDSGYLQI